MNTSGVIFDEALLLTPEQQQALVRHFAWKAYRKRTRPFRRAFRGIITRKEAERLYLSQKRARAREYASHFLAGAPDA